MKKVIKSICIRPEVWEELSKLAKKNNRSISGMIEELVKREK